MSKIVENLIVNEKKKIALNLLQDSKLSKVEIAEYFSFTLEQVNGFGKVTEDM